MRSEHDRLLNDLAEEEARLAALEQEYEIARTRVALLRERLANKRESGSASRPEAERTGPAVAPSARPE